MDPCKAKRMATDLIQVLDKASMPLVFDDHPFLFLRATATSLIVLVVMDEAFLVLLKIVVEHLADPRPHVVACRFLISNVVSLFDNAGNSCSDNLLNMKPRSAPAVAFLLFLVRSWRCQASQRDEEVEGLMCQMTKLVEHFAKARFSNHLHLQRLQINSMKHWDLLQEAFKPAMNRRRNRLVEFGKTVIDRVLLDLCKRDKHDDEACTSLEGN